MTRTRLSVLVALFCAAMLVLQGCGGGDDNSVEEDLRAQVDMLESDLTTAQEAQQTAAAAQMAAEHGPG